MIVLIIIRMRKKSPDRDLTAHQTMEQLVIHTVGQSDRYKQSQYLMLTHMHMYVSRYRGEYL